MAAGRDAQRHVIDVVTAGVDVVLVVRRRLEAQQAVRRVELELELVAVVAGEGRRGDGGILGVRGPVRPDDQRAPLLDAGRCVADDHGQLIDGVDGDDHGDACRVGVAVESVHRDVIDVVSTGVRGPLMVGDVREGQDTCRGDGEVGPVRPAHRPLVRETGLALGVTRAERGERALVILVHAERVVGHGDAAGRSERDVRRLVDVGHGHGHVQRGRLDSQLAIGGSTQGDVVFFLGLRGWEVSRR